MAIYEHVCENPECGYEWEDMYSIKQDPPKICPKCNQETAKRVISLTGRGVVELTGEELKAKAKADAKQFKKDVHATEKAYSNFLGEDKYQALQKQIDNSKKNKG